MAGSAQSTGNLITVSKGNTYATHNIFWVKNRTTMLEYDVAISWHSVRETAKVEATYIFLEFNDFRVCRWRPQSSRLQYASQCAKPAKRADTWLTLKFVVLRVLIRVCIEVKLRLKILRCGGRLRLINSWHVSGANRAINWLRSSPSGRCFSMICSISTPVSSPRRIK